ncbi:NAD-dependent epimerase/dehydratase family protein [Gammaproteobacteria bacterium]|nr:NAD-dependent epimerase/dehydratase family protein [Gammaproteobacteria bacterium]
MTILVTGGTGFLGRRLLKALEERDEDIIVVSRQSDGINNPIIKKDLSTDTIDISDLHNVTKIFHLAAYTHDLSNPKKLESLYESINVVATKKLAKLAMAAGVQRFIYISSVKAGEPNIEDTNQAIDNNHIPQGIYGRTKRKAEINLLEMSKDSSMNVTILRPSLIYGEGAKGNLALMLKGIKQGWFPRPPSAKNRRSMIHVDDLVRALLFLENNESSFEEIYIATDGLDYSIEEIYKTLCDLTGKKYGKYRLPLSIIRLFSNLHPSIEYKFQKLFGDEYYSSKKLSELGFHPKYKLSNLNEKIF